MDGHATIIGVLISLLLGWLSMNLIGLRKELKCSVDKLLEKLDQKASRDDFVECRQECCTKLTAKVEALSIAKQDRAASKVEHTEIWERVNHHYHTPEGKVVVGE